MQALSNIGNTTGHGTAEYRWSRFGPYYAMFPIGFVFDVIRKYTKQGDAVLDPFAGRFSTTYAAGVLGRASTGIEINPIGWLYGKTKLNPAPKELVEQRLLEIYQQSNEFKKQAENMNEFFQLCFCHEVLKFLLSAQANLNWKHNPVDSTLMAIILVNLHGKLGEGLSNQMRQTKAMGYNYSINWWKKHGYVNPPEINPFDFLIRKIAWRYSKGIPDIQQKCEAILGDSTIELSQLKTKYSFLFTSPPYCGIVDYHADQWIRLWLLNESIDKPTLNQEKHKGRFNSKEDYEVLLSKVFSQCAKLLEDKSVIFVRTDAREFTFKKTQEILESCFPSHQLQITESVVIGKNQTELFGNKSIRKEVDMILLPENIK